MKGITEGWLRAAMDDLDGSAMQLTRIKYGAPRICINHKSRCPQIFLQKSNRTTLDIPLLMTVCEYLMQASH